MLAFGFGCRRRVQAGGGACGASPESAAGRHITPGAGRPCMALRHVRPLPREAWDDFVAALKRGPTPEQVRVMERAEELTGHMVRSRNED